jgi:acyl transferase domain-containing protein
MDRTVATAANTIANRVSYVMDITGPSFYLDTACSSTLTAMHVALQSIQNGECEGAFIGGCQLNTK